MKIIKLLLFTLTGVLSYLHASPSQTTIEWQKIFDVRDLNSEYVPQGIDIYKEYVIFTVHVLDKKSVIIVFKKEENTLEYLFELDMPAEATHTSDLNVIGDIMYAIDYASNKIYEIDLIELINHKVLSITNELYLNMSRTGSLAIVEHEGEKYVLFSRFILSNKLIGFKLSNMNGATLDESSIEFEIRNHRFVQGLYVKDDRLFVSTNNFGIDTITVVDINKMFEYKDTSQATLQVVNAPYKMVEDLTMRNNRIITSDEESFCIYESQELSKI